MVYGAINMQTTDQSAACISNSNTRHALSPFIRIDKSVLHQ
jgi:hypothetical protein